MSVSLSRTISELKKEYVKAPTSREHLAALIKQHRVARNVDMHEFADRAGVKKSIAQAWEGGNIVPTPREWARLCNMVHRGFRQHSNVWQAARAEVSNAQQAAADVRFAENEDRALKRALDVALDVAPGDEAPPVPAVEEAATLGAALRTWRLLEGLSQREVAELIGCHETAITGWEWDKFCPVAENFDKLVQIVPAIERFRADVQDIPKPVGGSGRPEKTIEFVVEKPRVFDFGATANPFIAKETAKTAAQLAVEYAELLIAAQRHGNEARLLEQQMMDARSKCARASGDAEEIRNAMLLAVQREGAK